MSEVRTIQVTFDCADPAALSTFWAEVLGYVHDDPPQGFDTWDAALEAFGVPEDQRNSANALHDPAEVGPRAVLPAGARGQEEEGGGTLTLAPGGEEKTYQCARTDTRRGDTARRSTPRHEAVLELKGTDTQAFDDAVEELAKAVNHHLTEEELTILNPAREEVGEQVRAELGEAFATERNRQVDDNCGTLTNVRRHRRRRPGRRGLPRRRGLAPELGGLLLLAQRLLLVPLLLADDPAAVGLDHVLPLHHRAQRDRGADHGNSGHGNPPNMSPTRSTSRPPSGSGSP